MPIRLSFFVVLANALLLGTLWTTNSHADSHCPIFTTPYQAEYFGSYKGWRLDTVQSLSTTNKQQWLFTLRAENPIGTLEQHSAFRLGTDQRIISDTYRYARHIFFKDEQFDIRFDWAKQSTLATRKDKQYQVPLSGGELDELNYQLALRCDLMAGLQQFSYRVAERKEVDILDFKIIGEEKLKTELGELDTVVLKRVRNNNNRSTTLWFAKDMDYLMVKLLQEERKDTEAYLLYIQSYSKSPQSKTPKQ